MFIGLVLLDCWIAEAQSLKEKRRVVLSLITVLRQRFNVSIAEIEYQNLWQRSRLAISHVNSDGRTGERMMQQVLKTIEADPRLQVLSQESMRLR